MNHLHLTESYKLSNNNIAGSCSAVSNCGGFIVHGLSFFGEGQKALFNRHCEKFMPLTTLAEACKSRTTKHGKWIVRYTMFRGGKIIG